MAKKKNELKVGIMVLVCVGLFAFVIFRTADFEVSNEGYNIDILFGFVGGVEKNAPVRLAGVEVGKVESVNLQYADDTQVRVRLWLDPDAKIRSDSKAYISSLGLMGSKYIELTGGEYGEYLSGGSTVVGEDPLQLEKVVKRAEQLATGVEEALDEIRDLAMHTDEIIVENRPAINRAVKNAEIATKKASDTLDEIKELAQHADEMVVDNKERLDNVMANAEVISQNFVEFSEDVKHHPWKLIMKGKEKKKAKVKKKTDTVAATSKDSTSAESRIGGRRTGSRFRGDR